MHGTPNNLDHISAFYIGRQELTKTDKKKIPYRLPQNWLGGRLFHYTAF